MHKLVVSVLVLAACGPHIGELPSGADGVGDGLVHLVRPGLATAVTPPSEYVATPHGYYHSSCIHEVGESDDAAALRDQPCAFPRILLRAQTPDATSGWIEDSNFMAAEPAVKMTSTFIVPSAPASSSSQLDYFFPGMSPADGSVILQPVLAWGTNPAGGGAFYTGASWSCGPSCVHGNLIELHVGDKISGTITGTSCTATGSCDWDIETKDTVTGEVSTLKTTGDTETYPWLFGGVLEAYGDTACDEYPASGSLKFSTVKFYDQTKKLISPTWTSTAIDSSLGCNYKVATTKQSTTLSFGPSKVTMDASDGTASTSSTVCQYACVDYGIAPGDCSNGWRCESDGCLTATVCN